MRKPWMFTAVLLLVLAIAGCSKDEEPAGASEPMETMETSGSETPATTGTETPSATGAETPAPMGGEAVVAVQPNADKLKAHAMDHITYPATRAQIIEACAQTTEFSAGEKKWISEHLPEGTYNSADEVTKALGM